MGKIKINLYGSAFLHENPLCSSHLNQNKYVEWTLDGSADTSMYVDYGIFNFTKRPNKYAWVAESSIVIADVIKELTTHYDKFADTYELIFTHDKRLLSLGNKMRFAITNACPWVQDRKIHDKTKLVSMIVSNKKGSPGYDYRLAWREKLLGKVDMFGTGFNRIERKEEGLNDYMFSFAMENSNYPSIFCEKITDCFATGTIPIFWGTPDIAEFFNPDGIIMLTDDFDLNTLTSELYYSKMDAIKDNFERAINLPTAEDYIYLNYLSSQSSQTNS